MLSADKNLNEKVLLQLSSKKAADHNRLCHKSQKHKTWKTLCTCLSPSWQVKQRVRTHSRPQKQKGSMDGNTQFIIIIIVLLFYAFYIYIFLYFIFAYFLYFIFAYFFYYFITPF